MKRIWHVFILWFLWPRESSAQYNCSVYTDSNYARACRIYNAVDSIYQGSVKCQYYLDSAIAACPDFAPAWREKSVPYLKRGDFITWRRLLDKAVELDPQTLAYRGWCRFKFLRDYEGALADLQKYDTLTAFAHTFSNDGSHELHVVMALCERALGNRDAMFAYFARGIDSTIAESGFDAVGLYAYLHLGAALLESEDYARAIAALQLENKKYDRFADTWYYLGKAYLLTGRKQEAKESFLRAKALFNDTTSKYFVYDIYCEMPDQVFPADVDSALGTLH